MSERMADLELLEGRAHCHVCGTKAQRISMSSNGFQALIVGLCPACAERITALLSGRTAEPMNRDDWRPIETAPKDGSKVLLFARNPEADDPDAFDVYAAWWDAEFDCDWNDDADDLVYTGAWTDGAVLSYGMEETMSYIPTHWQPLPDAPSAQNESEG